MLAESTTAPVPALVDGAPAVPAPAVVDLNNAAPAAFPVASTPLALAEPAAPAHVVHALARAALVTLAAAVAAAPPGCFAAIYYGGCYGNICFRSGVLVSVDSA